MRDRWYGDNRDLVKWGTVVHLARQHRAHTIFQIAFYHPEQVSLELTANGEPVPVPSEVWAYFRRITDIERLKSRPCLEIRVFDKEFSHGERRRYIQDAIAEIAGLKPRHLVVLLDPDTGIEPRRPGATHVTAEEVREVFDAIKPGDVLCLYQHARRDRKWLAKTRDQFQTAVGLEPPAIKVFRASIGGHSQHSRLPRNVALLTAVKPGD